ncbi:MAG TPA: GPP34 family phosphoprotein, partial [Streptosporangiaceae bacterium]|nr:GPP34 family phosphoprotein [Streptosporangiaceae bacterium]
MTGQANGQPVPGLGGTGRVADELYLIAHHELTGRPHLAPRAVGLGLAGALLAELLLAGAITVAAGAVVADAPGQADDQLTAAVAAQIAAEQTHPVADWLAFVARTAAG